IVACAIDPNCWFALVVGPVEDFLHFLDTTRSLNPKPKSPRQHHPSQHQHRRPPPLPAQRCTDPCAQERRDPEYHLTEAPIRRPKPISRHAQMSLTRRWRRLAISERDASDE